MAGLTAVENPPLDAEPTPAPWADLEPLRRRVADLAVSFPVD